MNSTSEHCNVASLFDFRKPLFELRMNPENGFCTFALLEKAETLQEFYKRKFAEAPGTFTSEIGHFNLFRLEPFVEGTPTNIPYAGEIFIRLCSSWARAKFILLTKQ